MLWCHLPLCAPFPQDDKLEVIFNLPATQVLKILGFLTTERLVSRMEVRETRKRARLDGAAAAAPEPAPGDDEGSDGEWVDEDGEKRPVNKVKVTVYYLNPCFFVDGIRYRIWRIKVCVCVREAVSVMAVFSFHSPSPDHAATAGTLQ